jgi:hypothetical protein
MNNQNIPRKAYRFFETGNLPPMIEIPSRWKIPRHAVAMPWFQQDRAEALSRFSPSHHFFFFPMMSRYVLFAKMTW